MNVSWNGAQEFVRWMNSQTAGQAIVGSTSARPYRLPTEAEWEYAARAGTSTPYVTGASISPSQARFGALVSGTFPVGSFPANAFGLNDMIGNVWEWVEDCYAPSYAGLPTDGSANATNCSSRVDRGGSWSLRDGLRSADRSRGAPDARPWNIQGFRVARTLD
jgi:formylglycine-generating enzyme required for sulfatase activity